MTKIVYGYRADIILIFEKLSDTMTDEARINIIDPIHALYNANKMRLIDVKDIKTGKSMFIDDKLTCRINNFEYYKDKIIISRKLFDNTFNDEIVHGIPYYKTEEQVVYENISNIPSYTGPCKNWYINGQIKIDTTYEDGQYNGPYKKWYENGQIEIDTAYINGHLIGEYKKWYQNGIQMICATYKNDAFDGKYLSWHENGQIQYDKNYVDGHLVGIVKYAPQQDGIIQELTACVIDPDDKSFVYVPTYEYVITLTKLPTTKTNENKTNLVDQRYATYYANTLFVVKIEHKITGVEVDHVNYTVIVNSIIHIDDDDDCDVIEEIQNKWIKYYKTKEQASYDHLIDDKLGYTGLYKKWYENGQINVIANYVCDKLCGEYQEWYPSGKLMKKETYAGGILDGGYCEWYENGNQKCEKFYKMGQIIGSFKKWTEFGRLDEMIINDGTEILVNTIKQTDLSNVYKSCYPFIVTLRKFPDTKTNECRKSIKDPRFAQYRADKLCVVTIRNIYDNEEYDEVTNTVHDENIITYIKGQTITVENFDDDFENIYSDGIQYYKTEECARFYEMDPVKMKHNGIYKKWFTNGMISTECSYKDGQLIGEHTVWDIDGNIIKKCAY
jgi:antitoxin component YwqK of YwqJK toxin-antitoxin module